MNQLLMTLMMLTILSIGHAGDTKGDGGGAIQCPGLALEVLDFYEARMLGMGRPHLGSGSSLDEFSTEYLKRLAIHSPSRAELFSRWLAKFQKEAVFLDSVPEDIDDLGVEIPVGCQWRQIVNQNPLLLPPGKKYLIDRSAWAELSELQKTGLIFHELWYRESTSRTSQGLRRINAFIALDRLNEMNLSQRLQIWKDAGLNWMEAQGLSFQINSEIQIKNEILQTARAMKGSPFLWRDQKLILDSSTVQFYPEGQVQELRITNELQFSYLGQNYSLSCNQNSGETIRFFQSGALEGGFLASGHHRIRGLDFDLFLWRIRLFEDGSLHQALVASGTVTINGRSYKTFQGGQLGDVVFHPNGVVQSFHWGSESGSNPAKDLPFHIWEQVIYPWPGSKLLFNESSELLQFRSGLAGKLKMPNGQWLTFKRDEMVNLEQK